MSKAEIADHAAHAPHPRIHAVLVGIERRHLAVFHLVERAL